MWNNAIEVYKRKVRNDIIEMLHTSNFIDTYTFDDEVTKYYNKKIFKDGLISDREFLDIAKEEKARFMRLEKITRETSKRILN